MWRLRSICLCRIVGKSTPKLTVEYGVRWSLWPQWHSKWGNLSEFLPQYYDRATAPVVDPKGGFIVSGNQYDGIVLPGNGVPSCGRRAHSRAALRAVRSLYHGLPDGLSPTHWNVFQPRVGMAYAFSSEDVDARRCRIVRQSDVAINRDTALGGNAPFQLQESVVNGLVDTPGGATQRNFPFTQTIQDPVFKIPTAWEWNGTFQREIGGGTTVEAGYVGRRGIHNQTQAQHQPIAAGNPAGESGNQCQLSAALRWNGRGQDFRELPERPATTACRSASSTVTLAGLQFGIAYTYSRSTDNGSSLTDVLPNAYSAAATTAFPISTARTCWWRITFTTCHFSKRATLACMMPWAAGRSRASISIQSGVPLSVRTSEDIAGVGPGSGNQFWNLVGSASLDP